MRVLRTTGTFYPHVTGPTYQAYRISKGLTERGHASPIVTSDYTPASEMRGHPPDVDSVADIEIDVRRYPTAFQFHQYRLAPTAAKEYFSSDFDIVHCHGYHSAMKDVFFICSRFRSKPFVVHAHGSFGKEKDPTISQDLHFKLYDLFGKLTVKYADAIVVSSSQEREEAIEFGIDPAKVHVIPVGKDPKVYTRIPREPPTETFRALFVGRLAPRRNVELLLESIGRVVEEGGRDIELRIVGGEDTLSAVSGGKYTETLTHKAQELGISDHVQFVGPAYGDDLVREFREAHVFMNASHYENFGQAILEAAFAGLPIISTPTGVASDIVVPGETGYLADDVESMTTALRRLSSDTEFADRLGQSAQQRAIEDFSWPELIDKYVELYESLLT